MARTLERIAPRGFGFNPLCSLYLPFYDGRCQGQGQELLLNRGMESGDPPTGWALWDAGASWARSNEQAYRGTYSGKLTRAGTNCYAYQTYPLYGRYLGLQAEVGSWVYATVANQARLRLDSGAGVLATAYHSGGGSWEYLSTSGTFPTGALYLTCELQVLTTDGSAYFDEASVRFSNIFMSRDHYGHPVQVLGPKHHPLYGYWFDMVDDVIAIPDHAAIQNLFDSPGGTMVAWINPASTGEGGIGRIWDKAKHYAYTLTDSGAGTCKVGFLRVFDGGNGLWVSTDPVITYLKPQMLSVAYDNSAVTNDPVICIDGNPIAITESTTPVGIRVTDAAFSLCVGNISATFATWSGYIMELWGFKGMLPPSVLQQLFLDTKGGFGR